MLVTLDGSGPLHMQLYRSLRAAILSGKLPAGRRLPSTRALAAESGVSRNTVLLAYDQLLGEGYAEGRRGSGTYVPRALPDDMTAVVRRTDRQITRPRIAAPRLSAYGAEIRAWKPTWEARHGNLPYDFRYGRPAFGDFPHTTWRRILARRVRSATVRELDYGPPAGAPLLRQAIADYLQRSRAVVCSPEQVLIVNGSQQGLDLAARVMVDRGAGVVLEEPHYAGARGAFAAIGARLVATPVDDEGLDISRISGAPPPRLVYVTPSHQFPTGVVMSLARRLALLAWAARENVFVIEDDYDSEYRYTGRPIESLQGLDRAGRVIYLGTFSKLMFPALRLGYLVLPETLVKPFVAAKALSDTGTAPLDQLALADFIRGGHFERHVRRSRARNALRRRAVLEAVAAYLGDRVTVSGGNAGVHVVLWLNRVRPEQVLSVMQRAADAGVGVYSVAPFYLRRPGRAGLLLGYASLTEAEIRRGVQRLADVIR